MSLFCLYNIFVKSLLLWASLYNFSKHLQKDIAVLRVAYAYAFSLFCAFNLYSNSVDKSTVEAALVFYQISLLCDNNDEKKFIEIIDKNRYILNSFDTNGNSIIHYSARAGFEESIKKFIHKLNVNQTNKKGETALFIATDSRDESIIKLLLHYGASVDYPNEDGVTPLNHACRKGYLPIVKLLIGHSADPYQIDLGNNYSLLTAIVNQKKEIVHYLLDTGVDPNYVAEKGTSQTPLMQASVLPDITIIRLLLEYGADPNVLTRDDQTVWDFITAGYTQDISELILTFGGNPNIKNSLGQTPLHLAAYGNINHWSQKLFRTLLLYGANPHSKDASGAHPLHLAAELGNLLLVKTLVNHGARLDSKDSKGQTPLHYACRPFLDYYLGSPKDILSGKMSFREENNIICKFLIENGAAVKSVDNEGNTPLQIACTQGSHEMIQYLIQSGADMYQLNKKGETAVSLTSTHNRSHIAKTLHHYELGEAVF